MTTPHGSTQKAAPSDSYDVAVVGAGPAGLSAALVLGRARRRVLLLDGGPPRNGAAQASHGFLTRDGAAPAEIVRVAREELRAYDTVDLRMARARGGAATERGFTVSLEDGETAETRMILLACGMRDVLPDVPGIAWSRAVHQCPHCRGWEVRDRPLGLIGPWPGLFERAAILRSWSGDLTAFATDLPPEGDPRADEARFALDRLRALGLVVHTDPLVRVERTEDGLRAALPSGETVKVAVLFVPVVQEPASSLVEDLGCLRMDSSTGMLPYLRTTSNGETTTSGVYAAGDLLGHPQSIAVAVGSGSRAAAAMVRDLAIADAEAAPGR